MSDKVLLRAEEAASMIGCKRAKFHQLVRSGVIPRSVVVRIPGMRGMRFHAGRLREWVDSLTETGTLRRVV